MYSGIIYYFKSPSGKYYVGQTKHEKERYYTHINAKLGDKDSPVLTKALHKYGVDSFEYKVVTTVNAETEEELSDKLNELEVYYIKYYDSFKNGYNCTSGGGVGKKLSAETRQKMSKSHSGKLNSFHGKKHTEESKQKMSRSSKGQIPWNKGKTGIYSEESIDKISKSRKRIDPWNKGIKTNQIPWNKGKTGIYSEESIDKISIGSKQARKRKYSRPVGKFTLEGKLVKIYEYYMDICEEYNVSRHTLRSILERKVLPHIFDNHIWNYIDETDFNSSTTILKGSTSDEDGNNEIPEKE